MPSSSGGAATEVAASMAAATVFPLGLNWTDVIKTRMQSPVAEGSSASAYSGGFGLTARRILAEEGPGRLWGTAMPAALMREVLVVGTRVGAYPAVRDAISQRTAPAARGGERRGEAGLGSKLAAGLVLGGVSGLIAGPCDLVRIRMQAEAGLCDASGTLTTGLRAGLPRRLHHTPQAFGAVFGEAGMRAGLLRGATANIMHSCCITMGTVPVYEHAKWLAKTHLVRMHHNMIPGNGSEIMLEIEWKIHHFYVVIHHCNKKSNILNLQGWSDGLLLHASAGNSRKHILHILHKHYWFNRWLSHENY